MGANTWPTDICASVSDDIDAFYEVASTVAYSCDGGVCVGLDGTVLEQMVRFQNVRDEDLPDSVTLSEETGRVTTFKGGGYETVTRGEIGSPWRTQISE